MLWHYPLTMLPRARRESCLVLSVTAIACIEFISTGFEYPAFFGPIRRGFYSVIHCYATAEVEHELGGIWTQRQQSLTHQVSI